MGNKITLTPSDIYEKEFDFEVRGYSPQKVDEYLDVIIKDYTEYNSIIKKQENEIKMLMEDNSKLKQELRRLKSNIEAAEDTSHLTRGVNNIDLLKRRNICCCLIHITLSPLLISWHSGSSFRPQLCGLPLWACRSAGQ